jgi:hypothetical protein
VRYRLTTLPARPVRLAAIGVTLGSIALVTASFAVERSGWISGQFFLSGDFFETAPRIFRIAPGPTSIGLTGVILLVSWSTTATYAYLMIHQLRLISRIYSLHTEVHFFRLGRLYAFSRQTLRSALGLLTLAYALIATAPDVINLPLGLGSWMLLVAGALATFFLPLLGIHRHLVGEKARLLSEAGLRLEAGVAELHRRMDSRRLGKIDNLNKALARLEIERAAFERIPTWPWERGTLRGLVAALVVPVLIWLAQFSLQRTLGG